MEGSEPARCDLCGAENAREIDRFADLYTHLPGTWRLLCCRRCGLVWRDQGRRAAVQTPPKSGYGPHQAGIAGLPRRSGLRVRLKRAALAGRGYPAEGLSPAERLAGRLLVSLPGNRLEQLPNYVPGGRLLDVGCGTGLYVNAMRGLGWRAAGLEPVAGALRLADWQVGLPLVAGRIEAAPLRDAQFDALVFNHSLEHTTSPTRALGEARRLLRAAGVVLIEVPNVASLNARLFGRYWFPLDPPLHLYHFAPATLRAYLEAGGFEAVQVWSVPAPFNIAASLQLVLNAVAGRRGSAMLRSRVVQMPFWPLAALEAALGRGGTLRAVARKPA